jgi:hypothetical protein
MTEPTQQAAEASAPPTEPAPGTPDTHVPPEYLQADTEIVRDVIELTETPDPTNTLEP